jgi:hypothetical protein
MKSIWTAVAAASLVILTGSPAIAQAPDALCATLDKAVAVGEEKTPFVSLAPTWETGKSFAAVPAPPGLEAAKSCTMYLAGTMKDGVVGGGEFNYFECTLLQATTKLGAPADTTAAAAHNAMAHRVKSCLAPKGWTVEAPKAVKAGPISRDTQRFFRARSATDVVVENESLERGRDPAKTTIIWTARLVVRTPNPKHPGYQAPQ